LATARFQDIPIPRWEIASALVGSAGDAGDLLAQVATQLQVIYQLELRAQLDQLKRSYAPFNPDLDERIPSRMSARIGGDANEFTDLLSAVLERGNYECLTDDDIDHAFTTRSLFPINVAVDMSVYEQFLIYARGETLHHSKVPRFYGLRQRSIEVPTFDRVCIYIRFKTAEQLGGSAVELSKLPFEPGTSVLKLFRNIPKADLEMLFPNCQPTMRTVDKLLLGIPALVAGVPVLLKLTPAVLAMTLMFGFKGHEVDSKSLITGFTGLGVLGGYLFRQWDKYKNRRLLFIKVLTENLYFRNLDSNEGVLTRVVDEADDEECKEALLGYECARQAGDWLTSDAIGAAVEAFMVEHFDVTLDFESADAVAKLEALALLERDGDRLRARPLAEVLPLLEARVAELSR
jgi:hypothetical protein